MAKKINRFLILIFSFFSFFFLANAADAATLYVAPSAAEIEINKTIAVNVNVGSSDQAMNAYAADLQFDPSYLEVQSVTSSSLVTFWVQAPAFSNASGTINSKGVIVTPGYQGSAGKLITVVFKAKKLGTTTVKFTDGSVLANDGDGTEILKGFGNGTYTIIAAPIIPPPPPVPPKGFAVSSPTHPDQNRWYSNNDPRLNMSLPSGTDSEKLDLDQEAGTAPVTRFSPAVSVKDYADLDNGVWYFHAQAFNEAGASGIIHYKLSVDTENPVLQVAEIPAEDMTANNRSFTISATDQFSGIDYYELQVDDGVVKRWVDDGSGVYLATGVYPGAHTLNAKVYDRAGNSDSKSVPFSVLCTYPVTIDVPTNNVVPAGEPVVLEGTTQYRETPVQVWIQKGNDTPVSQDVVTDDKGNFSVTTDEKAASGDYKVWVEVKTQEGKTIATTEKQTFVVEKPEVVKLYGRAVNALDWMGILAGLVLLLIIIIILLTIKLVRLRRRYDGLKDLNEKKPDSEGKINP